MPFADLALARRLAGAEGAASAAFVGDGAIERAGVRAIYHGPDSPLTQTFGLGIHEPATDAVLNELERFFHVRGAAANHEVSPLAGVELAQALIARGYRPIEYTSVMFRPVEPLAKTNPAIDVHRVPPGAEREWAEVSAAGWEMAADFFLEFGVLIAQAPGAVPLIATLDGTPIATACLRCEAGVALFAGASTVPAHRNRGAQRALLEARMNHASAVGCDLAMMCASPGSASQRNAERQGFRIAYTRTKWTLPPP